MSKSTSLPSDAATKTAGSGSHESEVDGELEALFRLSLEMLCVAGGDGYFKRVNPAFTDVLGHNSEELLARPFIEFIHPDDREQTQAELCRLIAGLPTVDFENRYRCRDGSYRWLSWKAASADRGARIYAVASDVTQRKQAAEALLESQRSYQRLLTAVTTYRYTVDVRTVPHSTWHSAECPGATGYSPDEYRAQPYLWIDMVHPDDRELVRRRVAEVLANEDVPPIEHRILHKDGGVRWVQDSIVLHRDPTGRLVSYDGLVQDITARKLVEDRFRRIVEFAPDAMVVVNAAGRIVVVNDQTDKLFGYTRAELLGQSVEVLAPERFRERHAALRLAYAASPWTRPMGANPNICCRRKDGSEFPADISLSPIESDEGTLVYAAIRDITERQRAAAKVRDNEVQLLIAQRIQARFLPEHSPRVAGFDIAGKSCSAEFTGGDMFDYIAMRDGSWGLAIGDVAGHGFAPALLMTSTHAYLRSLAQTSSDVGEILTIANAILTRETADDRFVTLLLARLDPQTRSFEYCSAGHPTAYWLDALGNVKLRLESTAMALGILPGGDFATVGPFVLAPGDLLLMITDGVLEAQCPDGESFGPQRTLEVIRARLGQPSHEIVDGLFRAVLDFSRREKPFDDITALVLKVEASG